MADSLSSGDSRSPRMKETTAAANKIRTNKSSNCFKMSLRNDVATGHNNGLMLDRSEIVIVDGLKHQSYLQVEAFLVANNSYEYV